MSGGKVRQYDDMILIGTDLRTHGGGEVDHGCVTTFYPTSVGAAVFFRVISGVIHFKSLR